MGNKNELKKTFVMVCIIVIASIGFIIIFVLPDMQKTEFKPEFNITIEECWDETKNIGYKLIRLDLSGCQWEILFIDSDGKTDIKCYDDYWKEQYPCEDAIECEYNKESCGMAYCSVLKVKIQKAKYQRAKKIYEPIYETEEVCEQVEVDEIKIYGGEINITLCITDFSNNSVCESSHKLKPKKDISIEWLNENCECLEPIYLRKKEGCIENETYDDCPPRICLPGEPKKCSKYSCGKYFVEVLKR